MKAIRFHQHGPADVLRYEEAPDPTPGPREALVRVRACALNFLDIWERRGLERVAIPLPHISGSDVSGEIVASSDPHFAAGTRVMLQPGISCGRCAACLSGADNRCPNYDVLGYGSDGGYAELVKVPSVNVIPIPDGISFVEAAAFPLTFLTAWHMLFTVAGLSAGETVLVLAAGSGVGQAAVQIAKLAGARVIATAGHPSKLDRARELGADWVLDHRRDDISRETRRLTAGRGADVVVEHIGEATWEASVKSLSRGGRLVTCGATSGPKVALDIRVLFSRQISLRGSYMGQKGELLRAAALFFEGRLRPVIDQVFPLAGAADAQRRLEEGHHFGKIVLEV